MATVRPVSVLIATALSATLGMAAAGCSRTTDTSKAGSTPAPAGIESVVPEPMYAESRPGIAVRPVANAQVEDNFKRSYLALASWKLFAPQDSLGMPLAAVVLDGSNDVTAAEMRIGRSDEETAVRDCMVLPAEATGPARNITVGGIAFIHYPAGDAAMSHYVQADSYRGRLGERCYAIDLLVSGTRPEVYDPPRQPPFSNEVAMARLKKALQAVYWQQ